MSSSPARTLPVLVNGLTAGDLADLPVRTGGTRRVLVEAVHSLAGARVGIEWRRVDHPSIAGLTAYDGGTLVQFVAPE